MPSKPNQAAEQPRVYGYVRVSTDAQAEAGQSLDVQQRQLEGWAMQRGAVLDAVHVEAGVSGAIPFHERPDGGKLWQLAQRGDTVVASKLDRMFRSASDCLAVVEAFKVRGVSLFLLDLNGGADDVSGNGIARLFLTIVSAFAEFERNRIGERIRATKQRQKARQQRGQQHERIRHRWSEHQAALLRCIAAGERIKCPGPTGPALARRLRSGLD
jgi:putative DNA-invertase from lambdoid prophage Rac